MSKTKQCMHFVLRTHKIHIQWNIDIRIIGKWLNKWTVPATPARSTTLRNWQMKCLRLLFSVDQQLFQASITLTLVGNCSPTTIITPVLPSTTRLEYKKYAKWPNIYCRVAKGITKVGSIFPGFLRLSAPLCGPTAFSGQHHPHSSWQLFSHHNNHPCFTLYDEVGI